MAHLHPRRVVCVICWLILLFGIGLFGTMASCAAADGRGQWEADFRNPPSLRSRGSIGSG